MAEKKTKTVRSKTKQSKTLVLSEQSSKEPEKKRTVKADISTRGRVFTGNVISDKMDKTVTVSWPRQVYVPKYERYEKRKSTVKAHNPSEINARVGDRVVIAECRPISKTKKFIVIEVKK